MGRIKTAQIKRITTALYKEHSAELTADFQKNKEVVQKLANIKSKKLRNVIAGYTTRLIKTKKIF
ncbi:MAG TPA: 30S ribosomal protein S17e [Candidatus Nanoarchaeia archaeon]|nr:30S ribosomal protein S17e [Candidatus Nanoarchaeia archaeon]